jgi:hypothetical protein
MNPGIDPSLIETVAAALVEPAAGLPGAATVGIAPRIDSILSTFPHYVAPVTEALALLASTPERDPAAETAGHLAPSPDPIRAPLDAADLRSALISLEGDRPDLFAPLLEVVVGAWALSEPVWEALGYEGQRDLEPAAYPIPEEIFEPLLARGPRWRQPPEVDR